VLYPTVGGFRATVSMIATRNPAIGLISHRIPSGAFSAAWHDHSAFLCAPTELGSVFSAIFAIIFRSLPLALLVFLVLTTYLFHGFTFWNVVSNQARHDHIVYLVTNLSIMGAMLFIVVNGAGQMSLDGKGR
jgi:uncharacterized membrane protein YphA (DoxX/SURF4 family)